MDCRITEVDFAICQPNKIPVLSKEIQFSGYAMFSKDICMKNKRIKVVKQWAEL